MKEKGRGKYHDRPIDGDGFSLLNREETLENGLFCVLVFGALNNDLLHCKEIDINTKIVNRWYLTLTGPFASRVGLGKSARLGLRICNVAIDVSKFPLMDK